MTRDARALEGEGMAAGDVVNTAARLQAAAPANGILVDAATYRATEHAIEYREAEPVVAKGKAEPVSVWEAIAPRARLGVDIAFRGGAALVGREHELDALRDAFDRACRERTAQLVSLVGTPGIGKSRLVYELWAAWMQIPRRMPTGGRAARSLTATASASGPWARWRRVTPGSSRATTPRSRRKAAHRRRATQSTTPLKRAGSKATSGRSSA